jgi:alpha-L-arabinofuranosidase
MAAQSPESRVDILLNEPVGAIAPEIYGHFVEHLGGVVYDGIWVGENCPRRISACRHGPGFRFRGADRWTD